jgi:hypothetical protein
MVPNQPPLDAGPLFEAGLAYARANQTGNVIADPGAYYFLSTSSLRAQYVGIIGTQHMRASED